MAIGVLYDDEKHSFMHDLESFKESAVSPVNLISRKAAFGSRRRGHNRSVSVRAHTSWTNFGRVSLLRK